MMFDTICLECAIFSISFRQSLLQECTLNVQVSSLQSYQVKNKAVDELGSFRKMSSSITFKSSEEVVR